MMDAVKNFLAHSKFSVAAYACLVVHFICGLILIPVTSALSASEREKFSCAVNIKSTDEYKMHVEETCYSEYEQTYNSLLPLYGFVLLSIGLTVLVSVIYSLAVSRRVQEIGRISNDTEEDTSSDAIIDGKAATCKFYVFYLYLIHLIARSLLGIVFTVLQHTVFYPNGFDFEFSCNLPTIEVTSQSAKNSSVTHFNGTSIACANLTASEKQLWGIMVSVLNTIFALIALVETIYLCRRISIFNCRNGSEVGWSRDDEFVTVYLLRKRYVRVSRQLQSIGTTVDSSDPDNNTEDSRSPNV